MNTKQATQTIKPIGWGLDVFMSNHSSFKSLADRAKSLGVWKWSDNETNKMIKLGTWNSYVDKHIRYYTEQPDQKRLQVYTEADKIKDKVKTCHARKNKTTNSRI